MNKTILYVIVGISLLMLMGCTKTIEVPKYICHDGNVVNDTSLCPILEPEVVFQTQTVTRYQCADNSWKDTPLNCPHQTIVEEPLYNDRTCLKLTNVQGKPYARNGWYTITGGVKNECGIKKEYVKIIFTYFDRYDNVIGTDFAYTDPVDLPAGMTAGFDSTTLDDIASDVARFETYIN